MDMLDPTWLARLEGLHADAFAIGDAALAEDFDEARFRTALVIAKAETLEMTALVHAAKVVAATLGDCGDPLPGYGAAILGLAQALRAAGRRPA